MRPHVPFALAALVLLAAPLASPAHAQVVDDRDKLAQTAMKFLAVGADPRSAALGDATTALTGGSDALFYNPAALAWQRDDADAMFSETRWIADIDYNHASASYRLGSLGVVGGSLAFADYGEMIQTVFDPTEGGSGYREVGTFSPSAFVAGVGFARAFSDRFAAGGQVKYAHQDFGAAPDRYDPDSGELQFADISEGVLAYDFGVFYRTGFESLNFARGRIRDRERAAAAGAPHRRVHGPPGPHVSAGRRARPRARHRCGELPGLSGAAEGGRGVHVRRDPRAPRRIRRPRR